MTPFVQTVFPRVSLRSFPVARSGTGSRQARHVCLFLLTLLVELKPFADPVHALEKYGRPLPSMEEPGEESRETEETLFGGYLLAAPFVVNPTFAARPDNTGLVGMRYMGHFEIDLYKQYLTFYTDQNFFSDRKNGWIILTEWDMTYAITGLIDRWGWRLQYERDAPLDRSGLKQIYADVLATGNFHAADDLSWWSHHFPNQKLNAYMGFGWLFHNSNYFARPDNTGLALFRYVAHVDLDLYRNKVVLYGDTNFFTDRELDNKLKPTELIGSSAWPFVSETTMN